MSNLTNLGLPSQTCWHCQGPHEARQPGLCWECWQKWTRREIEVTPAQSADLSKRIRVAILRRLRGRRKSAPK